MRDKTELCHYYHYFGEQKYIGQSFIFKTLYPNLYVFNRDLLVVTFLNL